MTLTLTLTPEKETRLQKQARRAGLTLSEYAGRVLDQAAEAEPDSERGIDLSDWSNPSPSVEARVALFRQWAESHDRGTPLLTDEAVGRDAIYGGVDD